MTLLGALLVASLAATPAPPLEYLGPKLPAQVKRVVTLAPSLTETVLALGAGERLVGVSRFDELPQVAALPRVGGFVDPSVEAVLALHPDLVLVQPSPGNRQPVEKLAQLGVSVLSLPLQTVADTLAALREVGRALGLAGKGEALAKGIERARAEVRARAARLPHPRVLFVYGFEPLVVAGPGSFADELLRDAGAVNAAQAARTPYPTYSVEQVLKEAPQVVVDASASDGGAQLERLLPKARWVKLEGQALLHPGPSLEKGLRQLFDQLHPGELKNTSQPL